MVPPCNPFLAGGFECGLLQTSNCWPPSWRPWMFLSPPNSQPSIFLRFSNPSPHHTKLHITCVSALVCVRARRGTSPTHTDHARFTPSIPPRRKGTSHPQERAPTHPTPGSCLPCGLGIFLHRKQIFSYRKQGHESPQERVLTHPTPARAFNSTKTQGDRGGAATRNASFTPKRKATERECSHTRTPVSRLRGHVNGGCLPGGAAQKHREHC